VYVPYHLLHVTEGQTYVAYCFSRFLAFTLVASVALEQTDNCRLYGDTVINLVATALHPFLIVIILGKAIHADAFI